MTPVSTTTAGHAHGRVCTQNGGCVSRRLRDGTNHQQREREPRSYRNSMARSSHAIAPNDFDTHAHGFRSFHGRIHGRGAAHGRLFLPQPIIVRFCCAGGPKMQEGRQSRGNRRSQGGPQHRSPCQFTRATCTCTHRHVTPTCWG